MPVLEAMAAGIPVACSDIPPLREVAGDARCFSIRWMKMQSRKRWIGSRRTGCGSNSPKSAEARAREFTWTRTAELTLAALTK